MILSVQVDVNRMILFYNGSADQESWLELFALSVVPTTRVFL